MTCLPGGAFCLCVLFYLLRLAGLAHFIPSFSSTAASVLSKGQDQDSSSFTSPEAMTYQAAWGTPFWISLSCCWTVRFYSICSRPASKGGNTSITVKTFSCGTQRTGDRNCGIFLTEKTTSWQKAVHVWLLFQHNRQEFWEIWDGFGHAFTLTSLDLSRDNQSPHKCHLKHWAE